MKKSIAILLIGMISLGSSLTAQDTNLSKSELRKQKRAERKEAKAKELEMKRAELVKLVQDTVFVLEANVYMNNRTSNSISPLLNFVGVNGQQMIIQFASENFIGINGVGGATNNGVLESYSYASDNPKKPITVQGRYKHISGGAVLPFEIVIRDDGGAQFTITNPMGRRDVFMGTVYAPENSNVVEGIPIFR